MRNGSEGTFLIVSNVYRNSDTRNDPVNKVFTVILAFHLRAIWFALTPFVTCVIPSFYLAMFVFRCAYSATPFLSSLITKRNEHFFQERKAKRVRNLLSISSHCTRDIRCHVILPVFSRTELLARSPVRAAQEARREAQCTRDRWSLQNISHARHPWCHSLTNVL